MGGVEAYQVVDKKMVTTDPLNYILESLRTHLNTNVTDPRANRDSANSPFVLIGKSKTTPQYPVITLNHISGFDQEEAAVGQQVNATQKGVTQFHKVQAMVITKEDEIHSSKSNEELVRNLGSQVVTALVKKVHKSTLKSSYDIHDVIPAGGSGVVGPDDNLEREIRMPLLFDVEFLYLW